jgi:hypothetical protein
MGTLLIAGITHATNLTNQTNQLKASQNLHLSRLFPEIIIHL